MAEKKKANSKSSATVTRIKASDTASTASAKTPKKKQASASAVAPANEQKKAKKRSARGAARPFIAFKNYFVGAWYELRQVRWPNRRATWGMTFAVIVYSAFFVLLVILLDVAFKYLFDVILGK